MCIRDRNSARTADGELYTGPLSITVVPNCCTPSSMPGFVQAANPVIVTVQPLGISFDPPAPLDLPNLGGEAPGTVLDLWSLNPVTGAFEVVGTGTVSSDGTTIETTSGGLLQTDWHFFVPTPVAGTPQFTFAGPTSFTLPAGQAINQSVFDYFTDPDDDILTFSINDVAGYGIGALTAVITGPGKAAGESLSITVTASDGALSTSRNFFFSWTNRPIYIGPFEFQIPPEGGVLTIDFSELYINPVAGDLTYSLQNGIELGPNPTVSLTAQGVFSIDTDTIGGFYDFSVEAANANGTTAPYLQFFGQPNEIDQGPVGVS